MTLSERQLLLDSGWEMTPFYPGYYREPGTSRLYFGPKALEIQSAKPAAVPKATTSPTPATPVNSPIDAISVVALDALLAMDAVTITGSKANSANSGHFGKVVGLIQADTDIGFSGQVLVRGMATLLSWTWTPGAEIYLNGTTLSEIPPATGFNQQIGIAQSATSVYVDLVEPVLL